MKRALIAAVCFTCAVAADTVQAQSYPVKPVRLVVPTAPGGGVDIISRLNGEIVRMLDTAEVRERLASQGFESVGSTPEQFAVQLRSEIEKWTRVIRETGVRAD